MARSPGYAPQILCTHNEDELVVALDSAFRVLKETREGCSAIRVRSQSTLEPQIERKCTRCHFDDACVGDRDHVCRRI